MERRFEAGHTKILGELQKLCLSESITESFIAVPAATLSSTHPGTSTSTSWNLKLSPQK
jgi:hypothetical protein